MQCGNLSLLIQRRFSLLERGLRLAGWHREADATVMFYLVFLSTPSPSFLLHNYNCFLSLPFTSPFLDSIVFLSLSTSLFILCGAVHYMVEIQKKEVFLLLISASPFLSPPSSSLDPALTILIHEIMFCLLRNDSLLIIKYYDYHFHYLLLLLSSQSLILLLLLLFLTYN